MQFGLFAEMMWNWVGCIESQFLASALSPGTFLIPWGLQYRPD